MRLHPATPVRAGALFVFRRRGRILELHLDSRALARMRAMPGYSTFRAVREMRDELAVLASRVRSGELGTPTAVSGTSLMGEAGAVLGFELRPLPHNLANSLKRYYFVGLDAIYNPLGLRARATRRWPVETWMPVDQLLRRYPEKSARSTIAR
jgi:hypothetical protein